VINFTLRQLYLREKTRSDRWIGGLVDFRAGLKLKEKRKALDLPGI
jgi:hypothetical protein